MKNYILLTIGFVFLFQFAFCQIDTLLYYAGNNKPSSESDAVRYVSIKQKKSGVFNIERYLRLDGEWDKSKKKEIVIVTSDTSLIINIHDSRKGNELIKRIYSEVDDGYHFKEFYRNGKLKQSGITTSFYPLCLEGKTMTFYKSGKLESVCYYRNNQMLSNKTWRETGEAYVDNLFQDADVMPQYPGGVKAFSRDIGRTVRYPIRAQENGITGCVFVHFVVNEEGDISNVCIDSTRYVDLNREAYRVIASMKKKWMPGILDGKKVKVAFTVPINFQLN